MTQRQPHPTFDKVFGAGRLTLGFVLPITRAVETAPSAGKQLELAALADHLGFAALWVRDVPLNSPAYPDPVGHIDPWVQLGALAAVTQDIALVTGAIVTPLRHPLHIAKAALSVDRLSSGRMILGLGSGDRASEFAAFGADVGAAPDLFRDHWARVASLVGADGTVAAQNAEPPMEVLPRPHHGVLPMLAVGSSRQTIDWIARNAWGWTTYFRPLHKQKGRVQLWASAVNRAHPGRPAPFAAAMRLQLDPDPTAPRALLDLGVRLGRHALVDELIALREIGVGHVMFNIAASERPLEQLLDEIANDVAVHLG
jgi:luciferase-type oxidoreductase